MHMLRERLWLSATMFASIENQTCYDECQSLLKDTILKHGPSFYYVKILRLWVPVRKCFLVSRERANATCHISHESHCNSGPKQLYGKRMLARSSISISNCFKPRSVFCTF